jgi:hypothetical protein
MISLRILRVARSMITKLVPVGASDSRAVMRAAARQARSTLDDARAKSELEREVSAHGDGVRNAHDALRRDRAEFVTDRAFRLLDAVVCDTSVDAISAAKIDIFTREEELGRTSVELAFGQLAEMEPRLDELVRSRGEAPTIRLSELVGPNAQHPDPLMRSQLALSIATHYLAILNGKLPPEAKNESYFSARRRVVVRSGALTGPDLESPSS